MPPTIRLVVNVESFGASEACNLRTLEAHRHGVVTSASLLGNCGDLAGARAHLGTAPELGVGMALALIEGPSLLGTETPTLLTASGGLRERAVDFARDWYKGAIAVRDVERELEAQIARGHDAGLALDHLCTVGHLGLLPGIGEIVEKLAKRFGIAGIRTSVEPPGLGWIADPRRGAETALLAGLAWFTRRRMGTLRHGPLSWGYLESGRLDVVRILEIIGRLAPGSHELLTHPGAVDGEGELAALVSPRIRTAIDERAIVLSRWSDLF
ncbi:MAG TPA: ChbG/HpnK family deacetylase [Polyangia bacterium]|jgi:predicted glycoside hydrolase/deacetylase ChbG (UPF0249 family)